MPRDFEALYRAQAQARTATVQNETVSLPPGYLVGYDVRLRQDYTVVITAGAANIGGRLVQITEDHQLADADWVAPKINSSRHYYIYLSAAGQWFVDIVAPVWNNQYLYYEQPDTNWRAVGKIFLADGNIIFGIKEVEKNEQTVTVAPSGFTGRADYYCTGENDQILINAAIKYIHLAYTKGKIILLPGEFSISGSCYYYSYITLEGYGATLNSGTNNITSVSYSGSTEYVVLEGFRVYSPSISGVTIQINLSGDNHKAIRLILEGSGSAGVGIQSANYSVIDSCYAKSFGVGMAANGDMARLANSYSFSNLTGFSIAADRGIISGCSAYNNTNTGITINSSNIQVLSNYCYNNGLDTGVANTNQDNFDDTSGTDTQVYSNSWQQPVAGEPTQGELKWLPQSTSTLAGNIANLVTTSAVWASLSFGGIFPVGAKSAKVKILVTANSSAAGAMQHMVAFSNDYSATPATGSYHPIVGYSDYAAASSETHNIFVTHTIPLDSSNKAYFYATTRTNVTAARISVIAVGYKI